MLRHGNITVHAASCQILTLRLDLSDARSFRLLVHFNGALVLTVVLDVKLREDAADALGVVARHVVRVNAWWRVELVGTGERHSRRIDIQAEVLRRILVSGGRPLQLVDGGDVRAADHRGVHL